MCDPLEQVEPSSKRSYAALFNPVRLGLGLPFVPSSTRGTRAPGDRPAPAKRVGEPASRTPGGRRIIEFTYPFGNDSLSCEPVSSKRASIVEPVRRSSGEARACAANRAKAIVVLETVPAKRRKSVVDLEEMTDGLQRASVAGCRRSSFTPRHQAVAAPRSSLAHFTPLDPAMFEYSEASRLPTHVESPGGIRITFPLTFPSPRLPFPQAPMTPLGERRAAFSDECLSPVFNYPGTPTSPLVIGPPLSPVPSSAAASLSSRSSYSLAPRSPRTSRSRDLAPDDLESARQSIRSPSGVNIRFPLVFPSRSPSVLSHSSRASSIDLDCADTHSIAEDEDEEDEEDDDDLAAVVAEVLERSAATTRRAVPTFASPFPLPFLSPSARTSTSDSFSKLTFPSMPVLFPEAPTIPHGERRQSVASSYRSPDEGTDASDTVATPSTFEGVQRFPLETGCTIRMQDIFAEAFAQADEVAAA